MADAAGNEPPFYCGVAMSVYQNSGGANTNWSAFEDAVKPDGTPYIANGDRCVPKSIDNDILPWSIALNLTYSETVTSHNIERCGTACNFWELYTNDIPLAQSLGSNAFRLSLEWSRIFPQQGQVDDSAVQRYHEIFTCIRSCGMEPFVTLHHFVQPLWFEELGGFEREENIQHFVDFAAFAAREFGREVKYFATFNEPNVVANCGWLLCMFPPAKHQQFKLAGEVLCNLYKAHTAAYNAMKKQPGCEQLHVGIVHSYMRFEALTDASQPSTQHGSVPQTAAKQSDSMQTSGGQYQVKQSFTEQKYTEQDSTEWERTESKSTDATVGLSAAVVAAITDHTWANDILRQFLTTGLFKWDPMSVNPSVQDAPSCTVEYQYPEGRPPCDYIGVNYYSRFVFGPDMKPTCYPGETMTSMGYAIFPDGLYEGLKHFSSLGVPMYVTETGCPDKEDTKRPIMMQTYMPKVVQALDEGLDVRGLFLWSLMDNWEYVFAQQLDLNVHSTTVGGWASGFTEHFGLYAWSPGSPERIPRPSAELWKQWCIYFTARGINGAQEAEKLKPNISTTGLP